MAPNGATSRKTPAPPPKPAKGDSTSFNYIFDDLADGLSSKLKTHVKANLPVIKKPGSWDSDSVYGEKKKHNASRPSVVKPPPPDLAKAFLTGKPMSDPIRMLKCTHCKRAVTEHGMPKHIERCLNKKQEKQRKKKEAKDARDAAARKEKGQGGDTDEEEEGEKSAMKSGASKKRKAVDEAEEGGPNKKKKKKDEPKAKASKPKAPVDVEKQCGVELPQGGQCARSLTCKSHSMGAKRAVPGRSAPYDKLLAEYQRKNQAKLQKAQFDANAPDPEDDNLADGPVDEEEEKDAFMAGIARGFGGATLYQPPVVPQRRKYEHNRLKGMLTAAFGGRTGGGLFGSGGGAFFAAQRDAAGDADGTPHMGRPSVAPGARSMIPPSSRKASVASAGGS